MTLFASPGRLSVPLRLAGPAAALLAAVLTASCSGPASRPHAESRPGASHLAGATAHPAPGQVPPTTPAAAPSPSAAPPTAPKTSPPPVVPPPASATPTAVLAPVGPCPTTALHASIGAANGAAGSIYYPLDLTNVSGVYCSLYGYPGVSFVSGPGGAQVGGGAVRNSTFRPSLVTLAPGRVAHASVQVVVAQSYPASVCKPVTARWLRVYPPGQYTPLYAGLTAVTCTGSIPSGSTLGIYVVRPGANGP